MSPNESKLLIDHLDQTLSGNSIQTATDLIRNDEEAAKEWKLLQFTVSNIREAGLYEQISTVRNQFNSDSKKVNQQPRTIGTVRTMSQAAMRVAAILVLVTVSTAVFKYMSVNHNSIYNDHYQVYDLNTSRAASNENLLDNAYRDKQWSEVITIVKEIPNRNNKHLFLAGIAHLELKQYPQAITSFKSVLDKNTSSDDDYFNDEAEYYLAMSYLGSKESRYALPYLKKIKKDKNHLYNEEVNNMGLDFTILALKEGKLL